MKIILFMACWLLFIAGARAQVVVEPFGHDHDHGYYGDQRHGDRYGERRHGGDYGERRRHDDYGRRHHRQCAYIGGVRVCQ